MNKAPPLPQYVAFQQGKRIAQGSEAEIAAQLADQAALPTAYKALTDSSALTLVFDVATGEQIELPPTPATASPAIETPTRPGRPKLGVVAREVTLLPHDWEWLNQQPGGASVTLRKLVLKARRASAGSDRLRQAQVVCYRFISAIAGNETGFEEATRALFTGQPERFEANTMTWPEDVRQHARLLAALAFSNPHAAENEAAAPCQQAEAST